MTKSDPKTPSIAVIIPTLNAASVLPTTIKLLQQHIEEVVVVDGGSTDDTKAIAQNMAATLIDSAPGRGQQLRMGADVSAADWLLFLHADTKFSIDAFEEMSTFIKSPENETKAAHFRFTLDDDAEQARLLERRVAWRCKVFALPYGDQGLLIKRAFYEKLGGYKPLPLMEDVDLIWRIHRRFGKKAIVTLNADAITSAEKFKRDGYFKRSARNLFCLFLFRIHISARLIAKIY